MSLFFALWPDADFRAQAEQRRDQLKAEHRGVAGGWVATGCYHLTLQDITAQRAMLARAIAAADAARANAFPVQLDHAAGFENRRTRRYQWMLSSKTIPPGLKDLRRELLEQLRRQGCTPAPTTDRPHLSLHYNAGRQLPERPIQPLNWQVADFALLQGRQAPNGDFDYEVIGRWPLAAASEPDHARQFDLWDNPG